jgi:hypothetical protein
MNLSPWNQIKRSLSSVNPWLPDTPEKALDRAYRATLEIKQMEDKYFQGQKINWETSNYGASVQAHFNAELKKNLQIIKNCLAEFNASSVILEVNNAESNQLPNQKTEQEKLAILDKLSFIDNVIAKYNQMPLIPKERVNYPGKSGKIKSTSIKDAFLSVGGTPSINDEVMNQEYLDDAPTGFLPRSLFGTLGRIKKDLDPESEKDLIKNYRKSRVRTIVSVRLFLLIVLIPLLTQQISKNFIIGPVVDHFHQNEQIEIFLNINMEEDGLAELKLFQEKLEFNSLLGMAPKISSEEKEKLLQEKATEIAEDYRKKSAEAYKNIFADILSVISLFIVILFTRKQINVLKYFIDDVGYNLSDSAKAFIIILSTDIFVGFHSPHGWEILLESTAGHFGLPENREFNYLFIATFPVVLDTVFKYWIFRYLNRSSPSAVATYKNMNE